MVVLGWGRLRAQGRARCACWLRAPVRPGSRPARTTTTIRAAPRTPVRPEPDAGPTPDAQEQLPTACEEALDAVAFDFETGPSGWTHNIMPEISGTTVDWRFDDWEHGTASNVGPAACHEGTGCWATRLDNYYIACQRAYLRSPQIDLSACAGEELTLTFYHWYDFWTDDWDGQTWFDGGIVQTMTSGGSWTSPPGVDYPGTIAINPRKTPPHECIEPDSFYVDGMPGFVGASGGWELVEVPIPAEMVAEGFRIRFAYSSGVILDSTTQNANSFSNAGWYIDDLAIVPSVR
jgi:hypothetical protein